MPATERRGRTVTFSEALGGKEEGPLFLNTAESAACRHCNHPPRLYVHTSSTGREIAAFIPEEHICRGPGGRR